MAKESFKVSLPGSLYQKNARWWWKVKLPGETRLKDMGLKPKGARFATTDRVEAEEVAVGIWESAIRKEVQGQARARAREKAKAVAKEMARVEAEAAQTVANLKAKIVDMVDNARAECEKKVRRCNELAAQADERVQAESEKRAAVEAEYEEKLRRCNEALAQAQEQANAEAERRMQAEAKLEEVLGGMKTTAPCDCCGKGDVPEDELSTIDSGHRLCSDCIASLRG